MSDSVKNNFNKPFQKQKSKTPCHNKRTFSSTAPYLHFSLHGYEESRGRKR